MKKSFAAIVLLAIILCLGVNADGFAKSQTYKEQFADVKISSWYYSDVKNAFELGFVNGLSDNAFAPDGKMTVGQAITLVSRMNSAYFGREVSGKSGGIWYDMYVDYAISHGIISAETFNSYDRNILRHEMASLFATSLPPQVFNAVNDVNSVPDVAQSDPFCADALTLYKSGIVMGSDDFGTFNPYSEIRRSEVAAMVSRVALPESRLHGNLSVKKLKESFLICKVSGFDGNTDTGLSGWSFDSRGAQNSTLADTDGTVSDVSTQNPTSLLRHMNVLSSGKINVRAVVRISDGWDGFGIAISDSDGKNTYRLDFADNTVFCKNPDGSKTDIKLSKTDKNIDFYIVLDLDAKKAKTFFDGNLKCESSLLSDNIADFGYFSDEKSLVTYTPLLTLISANYSLYESGEGYENGTHPILWKDIVGTSLVTDGEIRLDKGEKTKTEFEPIDGKACLEMTFKSPADGVFSVGFGNAVTLQAKNGSLYCADSQLCNLTPEMWYRLKAVANPDADTAEIFLNGKTVKTVGIKGKKTFDNVTVNADSAFAFFDVKAYGICDESDYVPVPTPLKDDYFVGVNVCSLWHEGSHAGWECVTPYDDHMPILGYYDEGSPESADWEIKYMTEHGIDFENFCWYADKSDEPIKKPRFSEQLHDGYMYAKYSDTVKFSLLWEVQNGVRPKSSSAFRSYFVPYWLENYFNDKRYMTVDNRAIMSVFGAGKLIDVFGSEANVKTELDYLRSKVRELGYDDLVILACGTDSQTVKDCGFDGVYTYNIGSAGFAVQPNIDSISQSSEGNFTYTVPCVSVGYDTVAWSGKRYPHMTPDDFVKANEWVRDTYLAAPAKQKWQKNLVMLSCWNEYGEGTYISPTGLCGFDYLDGVRNVYGGRTDVHNDPVPSLSQKTRITRCYPQYYRILAPNGFYSPTVEYSVNKTIEFADKAMFGVTQLDSVEFGEFGFCGVSTDRDPTITTLFDLETAAKDVDVVRVYAKVGKGSAMQIFFITDDDNVWNEAKSQRLTADSDELKYYDFDMSDVYGRNGFIKRIRFDPMAAGGLFCQIKKIEFLGRQKGVDEKLTVNGVEIENAMLSELAPNGNILYPFNPKTGIFNALGIYYVYNYYEGRLDMYGNGHTVSMTVGSSDAIVGGKPFDTGSKVYLEDNIPILPLQKICEYFGFDFKNSATGVEITTGQNKSGDKAKKVAWEFNTTGDTEGWYSASCQLLTAGGTMRCVNPTVSDPTLMSKTGLEIDAERYKAIELRVKYTCEGTVKTDNIGFYYITDKDKTWNEAKHVRINLATNDTKDEFVTITISTLDSATWCDTITQLRFDPFNQVGTMYVDYIRLVEDEGYVPPEKRTFALKNGDAENTNMTNAFFSANADISIVADAQNVDNHYFRVDVKNKEAKNWTYFRQNVVFTPGKKYNVEYDVKLLSRADGNTDFDGSVCCNFRYIDADGKTDHVVNQKNMRVSDGWVHVSFSVLVPQSTPDRKDDQFAIYSNPDGELGVNFCVDNVKVTEA